MGEEVERPSCDVAVVAVVVVVVVVVAQGVADKRTVALDTEGIRTPVAFAPGLERTNVHVDHDFGMT